MAPSSSSSSAQKKKDLKQGSLFSFFSKKKQHPTVGEADHGPTKKGPITSFPKDGTGTKSTASPKHVPSSSPSSSVPDEGGPGRSSSSNNKSTRQSRPPPATAKPQQVATNNSLWKKVKLNARIAVYWQDDRRFYACQVLKQREAGSATFFLRYEDGEQEWLDLSRERFKLLHDEDGVEDEEDEDESDEDLNGTNRRRKASGTTAGTKRRRQIQDNEDSEDENEWQDDEDDDGGSDFEAPEDGQQDDDDDDEMDDDHWMVTDDEEAYDASQANKTKRPKKKARNVTRELKKTSGISLKVTKHGQESLTSGQKPHTSSSVSPNSPSLTPMALKEGKSGTVEANTTSIALKTPLRNFSHTVSPLTTSSQKSRDTAGEALTAAASTSYKSSLPSSATPSTKVTPTSATTEDAPLEFVRGVVNPRGSHVHNHLKFLRRPKDAQGRSPDHPQYDSRTLLVNKADWDAVNGGKMTEAVQQWWDLKAQYFDTVLLFKTGKFYEMFHMDADIGVSVLGLIYMKGHVAHSGFPEISYGTMADRLVRAGYKVARVEQTETPEQLKKRNDDNRRRNAKTAKTAKVVNREVCSILTLGTRTFCALDDESALMNEEGSKDGTTMNVGGCGPLLAVCETLVEADSHNGVVTERIDGEDDDDNVRPVCEYGITIVDAIRGTVTLGQFADDVLRSRMHTLLTAFAPSEILVQGRKNASCSGASPTLLSLLRAHQSNSRTPCRLEIIHEEESFPKSTALDPEHRRQLERGRSVIHPWHVQETIEELHRKRYYPRASRQASNKSVARWPPVLKAVVEGGANLCLSSFGATLFYLQRNLIDHELLSMGIVKAYVPQASPPIQRSEGQPLQPSPLAELGKSQGEAGNPSNELEANPLYMIPQTSANVSDANLVETEEQITYMSLDGTTLHNLEILTNAVDFKVAGSLWGRINYTKSPHGARMLRAWLLRPLFRKNDIDRRADAVQEMVAGAGNLALKQVRQVVLSKIGDLERLLSRVHSMGAGVSYSSNGDNDDEATATDYHPNERAVLYCGPTYTKRKVGDFSKVLNGLRRACQIPDIFADMDVARNGLLFKLVRLAKDGGCFPDMVDALDWYFENFDCDKAANGMFELAPGCDPVYDQARNDIQRIKDDLERYREDICNELQPRHVARSSWKYINTKPDSKDKYLIELPASVNVPHDFFVMGKRGSGQKQVNKYRTPVVEELVKELEQALELREVRKAKGMQLVFARFDAQRSLWAAAAHATSILDALGSLSCLAGNPGYCRPEILDCPARKQPSICIKQGRHPCVEHTFQTSEFIPNDLTLGPADVDDEDSARLLLLSGKYSSHCEGLAFHR